MRYLEQNTQVQIAQARETLVLRRAVQKWRDAAHARVDLYERVSALADARLLRRVTIQWTAQLAERRQLRWRNEMRGRMKAVRKTRERRVLVQAWEKWKAGVREGEAERVYERRLMSVVWERWKEGLRKVGTMEVAAERFEEGLDGRMVERVWEKWKGVLGMRQREMVLVDRVNVRVMESAWDAWKKRMSVSTKTSR
jgi:protein SFI1